MRKYFSAGVCIFISALLIRLAFYQFVTRNWSDFGDTGHYIQLAQNIAEGKGFTIYAQDNIVGDIHSADIAFPMWSEVREKYYLGIVPYGEPCTFWDPLLPFSMAAFVKIGDPGFYIFRIFGCILGALSCVLIYSFVRRLLGTAAGITAGVLMAVSLDLVTYSSLLMTENMAVFFLTAAIWCFYRENNRKAIWLVSSGFAAGLTYLSRANLLIIMPIILLFCWIRLPKGKKLKTLYVTAGFLIAVSPWWIRNLQVKNSLAIFPSKGAYNFWISSASVKILAGDLGITLRDNPGETAKIASKVKFDEGIYLRNITGTTEDERAKSLWNCAFKFIKANPSLFVKSYFKHLLKLFNPTPAFGNKAEKLFLFCNSLALFILGFLGMCCFFWDEFRRWKSVFPGKVRKGIGGWLEKIGGFIAGREAHWFILCYFFSFAFASAFFRFGARFRLPAGIVFIFFIGYLVMKIAEKRKRVQLRTPN